MLAGNEESNMAHPGLDIANAAPHIARAILDMVRQYRHSDEALQRYYYVSLKWMARHLEAFVAPRVSIAAHALADQEGLGDLHRYRWLDQPSKMKDLGREKFHWEHATQTSDVVKAILAIEEPSAECIAAVLRTMTIVWVTKKENKALPSGARNDWEQTYREAGIELLPRPAL
jgi:hypothetical protein